MVRVAPSASTYSTPVARRPLVRIRVTNVSAMSCARPVAIAFVSSATGSPLAWIGHPKNAENPQLLQAGRPS